jgi:hypothetical protein
MQRLHDLPAQPLLPGFPTSKNDSGDFILRPRSGMMPKAEPQLIDKRVNKFAEVNLLA